MSEQPDAAEWKRLLLAKKAELEELDRRTEAERAPVELDQTRVGRLSRMDAIQVQAMAQEAQRRRRIELQRLDAALDRLAKDEFGECLSCGELIASRRLELDPAATLCIECARR